METYTTDAINIKTYPLSENDNIVVMFSKEKGLIRGIAKGVKRPKSKLGARMQTLVCNTLMLNKKQNLDIIKEASALNPFNKLRYDLEKLTMALYIVEIINTFCAAENLDEDQNKVIYELLYKTLNNIQNSKNNTEVVLSAIKFQLKFMNEAGFGLELQRCLVCSKETNDDVLLSLKTGGIVCMQCAFEHVQYIKLNRKIKDFLNTLSKAKIDEPTRYDNLVNEKVAEACFNLLKKYIEVISNKKSKTFKVMEATKVS